jgi:hypothetical protein
MSSFIYPVYRGAPKGRNPKTPIRFYYCAEKSRTKQNMGSIDHVHGTVLDVDKNVIRKPEFYVTSTNYTKPGSIKYKMLDCTVVNFFHFENKWYMSTKNSWDISEIAEHTSKNNMEIFNEIIKIKGYNFNLEDLDKNGVHTFAFSHPETHLLSNEYRIWSYSNYDFVDSPELETDEKAENYILFDKESGEINVRQTDFRKRVVEKLYTNRRKYRNDELNVAFLKMLVEPLFNLKYSYSKVKEFLLANLNANSKRIFELIMGEIDLFNEYIKVPTEYNGIRIPESLTPEAPIYTNILQHTQNRAFLIDIVANKL